MIRTATFDDSQRLGHIHVRSWQEGYKDDFDGEFLAGLDVQARVEWFQRFIAAGTPVLVADLDGDPVGFSVVGAARSGGSEWGEVFSIYVHPDYWGQGFGFRLLSAAEAALRDSGFERALLWVLDSNSRARSFYQRQGWVLGRQIKLEQMGGIQVNEVRYEKDLRRDV